jgi:transcription-repair coupling factor (superfamily II helicase)
MVFGRRTCVDPLALVHLVQTDSRTYRMQGAERLQFRLEMPDDDDRFTLVEQLLQKLASKASAVQRTA